MIIIAGQKSVMTFYIAWGGVETHTQAREGEKER